MSDEYRVEIQLDCDVFKFDTSEPTVLKRAELEDLIRKGGGRKKRAEKKTDEKVEKL